MDLEIKLYSLMSYAAKYQRGFLFFFNYFAYH